MPTQTISDHKLKSAYIPAHELSRADFEAARDAIRAELRQYRPSPQAPTLEPYSNNRKCDLETQLEQLNKRISIAELLTAGQLDKTVHFAEIKGIENELAELARVKHRNDFTQETHEADEQAVHKAHWEYLALHYTHLLDTEYIGVDGYKECNSLYARQTGKSPNVTLMLHLFNNNFHYHRIRANWCNHYNVFVPSAPDFVIQDYPEFLPRQAEPDPEIEPESQPVAPPRKPNVERQAFRVYEGVLSIWERYPGSNDRQMNIRLIDDTDRGYMTRLNHNDLRSLVGSLHLIAVMFESGEPLFESVCIAPRWAQDDEIILDDISLEHKMFSFNLISYLRDTDEYRRAATMIYYMELPPVIAALETALERISPHKAE